MRRSLLSAAVSVLLLSALGVGCGIGSDESSALPSDTSDSAPESSAPHTSSTTTTPSDSTTTVPSPDTTGDAGALCDRLKVIADADQQISALPDDEKLAEMKRSWPDVAIAYDEAIAIAPPDLAGDLGAIKRVSELIVEALNELDDTADPTAAVLEAATKYKDEVIAGGQASIRASEFTEDQCGFSLNNE